MSTVPHPADDDPTTPIEQRLLAALTVTERLAAPPPADAEPGERSRWRLSRWRTGGAFADDEEWRRRLAAEGLDEGTLLALLDESPARLAARLGGTPEWIRDLVACYRAASTSDIDPELLPGRPLDASLALVAPLVARARARVARHVRHLADDAPDLLPPDADRLGVTGLLDELVVVLSRAVVLELNIDRLRGASAGDTPQERYAAFFRRHRAPEAALALLAEYPVLARQAYDLTRGWADRTIEFLRRLADDAPALATTFHGGARPGRLVDIQETGDPHRDGRRVLVATFDSGLRLVYKPRPVAVEARFQRLLEWLNERGTDLHTFTVLPRGDHGWAEYVESAAPTTPGGRRRFARRYGSLLALLQAVGATDCHRENVVVHGEHPVLVDLETAFTPAVARAAGARGGGDAIADSVLAVGLLPRADEAAGPAANRCNCSAWQAEGTDEMRLCAPGHHHDEHGPLDPGADPADLAAHLPQVLDGFTATYRLLAAVRDELLAPDGPVTAFAADEIRVVLRPTRTYLRLRDAALHTDALQDGLDTERLHDWLWSGVAELPLLAATVAAERADLARRDVPMFTTTVDSRDLWTSRGRRLPGLLARSGLAEARRRLGRLGEADLERQRWLVRAAFTPQVDGADAPHARVRWHLAEVPPAPVPPAAAYLAAATSVADAVAALAFPGTQPTWFGLTPDTATPGRWAPAPLGPHLYDGIAGVTLFLAHAGRLTGEQRFTDLADRAAAGLTARILDRRVPGDRIGAFTGWGGLVYTLGHLGELWQTRRFAPAVDVALARVTALAATDQAPDLVDGFAGAVLAVSRAGLDPERVAPVVRGAARRLLAAADTAYADPPGGTAGAPLGGLAHGAAGIAAALAHAWAVTGDPAYADAATRALAYDRSLFRPAEANWADLRRPGRCGVTWCHGAPGIGLSRLLIRDALGPDDTLDTEITTAVATTLATGFGRNHSLCHGDLGNLDLLLAADPRQATAPAAAVLRDGLGGGWRCANPTALASPELMTGLSGVGLALLRLAAPERVPSVLLLAPPASAGPARSGASAPARRERQWAA